MIIYRPGSGSYNHSSTNRSLFGNALFPEKNTYKQILSNLQSTEKHPGHILYSRGSIFNVKHENLLTGGNHDSTENIGSGAYGRVILIKTTKNNIKQLKLLKQSLLHGIQGSMDIPQGDWVVIKLTGYGFGSRSNSNPNSNSNSNSFSNTLLLEKIDTGYNESNMLLHALKQFKNIPSPVPTLYFAGLQRAPVTTWITVMSLAPGDTLYDYRKRSSLTADDFARIEKAVLLLWAHGGISHMDMHDDNVLYDGRTATIVDLGFAVALPEKLKMLAASRIRQVIMGGPRPSRRTLDDLWFKDGLGGFAEAAFHKKFPSFEYTWYNSDGQFLRRLLSNVHPDDIKNIPDARIRAWKTLHGLGLRFLGFEVFRHANTRARMLERNRFQAAAATTATATAAATAAATAGQKRKMTPPPPLKRTRNGF
jgi:hypothetical protein